jgi:YVTN family beta-propeller protein
VTRSSSRRALLVVVIGGLLLSLGALVRAQQPRPLYALPDGNTRAFSSGSLALANNGRTLLVANMLGGTVSIVDIPQRQIEAEIAVGADPRAVAFTPDGSRALVVSRGAGALAVIDMQARSVERTIDVGAQPYAVVARDASTAYVSLQSTSEVLRVDLASGDIATRIPVPAMPAGLALWGDFLYVTHFWSGQLSLIYLPQQAVVRTVATGGDSSLAQSLTINPRTGMAYLPHSRSADWNPARTYDSTVLPVVSVVDLAALDVRADSRLALNVIDRPLNMPFASALDLLRNWLFVVSAGSDALTVIDLATGTARAHIPVGANPRGVLLNLDSSLAIVHNAIDGTLTFIETRTLNVLETLPISEASVSLDRLWGAQLFHSAADPRMSRDHALSCASCHFDGQSDGRTWQNIPGGTGSTPALADLDGIRGDNDYTTLVEAKIREWQAGSGLPIGSLDLDALVGYLLTLPD